jgi:hypothetical protein
VIVALRLQSSPRVFGDKQEENQVFYGNCLALGYFSFSFLLFLFPSNIDKLFFIHS